MRWVDEKRERGEIKKGKKKKEKRKRAHNLLFS